MKVKVAFQRFFCCSLKRFEQSRRASSVSCTAISCSALAVGSTLRHTGSGFVLCVCLGGGVGELSNLIKSASDTQRPFCPGRGRPEGGCGVQGGSMKERLECRLSVCWCPK